MSIDEGFTMPLSATPAGASGTRWQQQQRPIIRSARRAASLHDRTRRISPRRGNRAITHFTWRQASRDFRGRAHPIRLGCGADGPRRGRRRAGCRRSSGAARQPTEGQHYQRRGRARRQEARVLVRLGGCSARSPSGVNSQNRMLAASAAFRARLASPPGQRDEGARRCDTIFIAGATRYIVAAAATMMSIFTIGFASIGAQAQARFRRCAVDAAAERRIH